MSQDKIKKMHLIYGCISAVMIVALGVLLILSCLDIYNSGPHPYSADAISLRFQRIAIIVYICIALVLGGIVLNLVLPLENKRPKALRDIRVTLAKLKAKLPTVPEDTVCLVKKERNRRLLFRIITAGLYIVLMIGPAIYFADVSHFTITSVNTDIRNAVCVALIPAAVGLLLCFICSLLVSNSIARETEIYKKAIASAQSITVQNEEKKEKHAHLVILRAAMAVIAAVLILVGIFNGGMKDVLDKAVAICTECIGLG